MIKLILQYLTASVLIVVAARQSARLIRSPRDPPLRAMAAGVLCVAIDATVNIAGSPIKHRAESLLGAAYPTVVNALWIAMAFCFAAFFILADPGRDETERARTVRLLALLLGLSVGLAAIMPVLVPSAFGSRLGGAAASTDVLSWPAAARTALFVATALVFWCIGLVNARRYLHQISYRWVRWSVRLVILGALGMALTDAMDVVKFTLRAVEDVHSAKRYPLTSAVYLIGLLGGQAVLAVGLVLPAIAAAAGWVRRRLERTTQARYNARMRPLWEALTSAFPYVVLPSTTAADPGEVGFVRRTAEITDALAQLGPYYSAAELPSELAATGVRDPTAAARIIHTALRAHSDGRDRAEPPFPRLEPDHTGWRDQAHWMVGVTRAFERRASREPLPLSQ